MFIKHLLIPIQIRRLLNNKKNDIGQYKQEQLKIENKNNIKNAVVIGTGSAGLFCAYTLSKKRVKVHIIERGERVEDRVKTIDKFKTNGILNPNSNIQFGEGELEHFLMANLLQEAKIKEVEKYLGYLQKMALQRISYIHKCPMQAQTCLGK